jgi:hypothetical protein
MYKETIREKMGGKMKKISSIAVFVFALFFVTGCTGSNTDILPALELIGDSVTEVEQYSEFNDPGIDIIGDFDLDVVTTGTVDTTTLGDYTITYTITYLGVSYEVSRIVRVVEVGTEIIPGIQLVGDATMEVEQYSEFVDPGASLIGDFNLDITVVSDVNTDIVGTYTISYTITYNSIDYTVSRSVEVIESTIIISEPFTIEMVEDFVTARAVAAIVTVDDEQNSISDGLVELYENDVLIDSVTLVDGINYIYFDALDADTTYTIKLSGDYLDNNNKLTHLNGYELNLTTLASGELSFDIIDPELTTDTISFTVTVIDEDSKLRSLSVEILDGQTTIDSVNIYNDLIDGELGYAFAHVSFDSLNPLSTYTIEIKYSYLPVGETIAIEGETLNFDYTTLQSVIPEVVSHDVIARYYTLDGTIILDDSDYEDYAVRAELYQNGNNIDTFYLSDGMHYVFDYLNANTDYSINIYADFTVISTGDTYESILVDQINISTVELGSLTAPTVENVVITHTSSTISVTFDLIDNDDAMSRGIIYLYKGSSSYGYDDFVKGTNTITFDSSIYAGNLYTVNIKADYTGNGSYNSIYEEDVYIPPAITINNFEPTDMFYSGDQLILKIELNNSTKSSITAVTINETVYSTFLFPSDYKTLYVDLGVKEADTYSITLQNLIVTFNEQDYLINTEENLEVNVYIPGTMAPDDADVTVIDIVPEQNYVIVNQDTNILKENVLVDIYLDNPYDLQVTGIKIGGVEYNTSEITILSYTHIQVTAEIRYNSPNSSSSSLYFTNITFERNNETVVSTSGDHVDAFVFKLYDFDNNDSTSNEIVHIGTPEELLAIANETTKKLYILDNDIDMSSYNWTPIGTYDNPFIGSFNGNGYTISNINIDMTLPQVTDTFYYIGLFGYTSAFISDLNIENMNITLHSDVSNYIYVGALAGKSVSDVVNVHVTNSSMTVDGVIHGALGGLIGTHRGDLIRSSADTDITDVTFSDETSNMRLYVGGLVGDKQYEDVRRSFASGDITIAFSSPHTVFAGGLLGTSSDDYAMVSDSYATGNLMISGDYYTRVGGLIGNSFSTAIKNSYASGNIDASAGTIGGLIGQSDGYVSSSFASGVVTCDAGTAGKVFGSGNTYRFDLMYAYDNQEVYYGDSPSDGSDHYYIYLGVASNEQFNDMDYYTDFLGWSNHFYNFTNLDIEQGDLPIFN